MTAKKSYLIDMDGVLVNGKKAIPGAVEFIKRLIDGGHRYLILTNNSRYTPVDLAHRLQLAKIKVDTAHVYNSALATAAFVQKHQPGGSAYVLGDTGLYQALTDVGYTLTDYNPNYVILGETKSYPYDKIIKGNPADLVRHSVHRHQPGPIRPGRKRIGAGVRRSCCTHRKSHRFRPLLRG